MGCIGGLFGSAYALEAGSWKLPAGLYDGSRGRVLYVCSARFGAAWSYGSGSLLALLKRRFVASTAHRWTPFAGQSSVLPDLKPLCVSLDCLQPTLEASSTGLQLLKSLSRRIFPLQPSSQVSHPHLPVNHHVISPPDLPHTILVLTMDSTRSPPPRFQFPLSQNRGKPK